MIRRFLSKPMRLPNLGTARVAADAPTIFHFNAKRDAIVEEVVNRALSHFARDPQTLEHTLNETAIQETKRLQIQHDQESKESLGFWINVYRRLARMSESEKRQTLRRVAERMARDIAGNFDPRVYSLGQKVVPKLLTGIMEPSSLTLELAYNQSQVDRLLRTEGPTEKLARLAKRGTLVFVPTHSSNFDSIALAYALLRHGLPPLVYGAGKNLFSNPLVSFFMHNLGAYRVDRRVTAGFYKDVLKSYACTMVEHGFHSLFFPGGTRSRSNLVETKLKLGLAGSAVEAFSRNQVSGRGGRVWFVPTTINYALVLEAETLIEDHLKEQGKARYIIDDDEFSRVDRWFAFFRKVVNVQSACVVRFGDPVDPFGNPTDDAGDSLSPRGHVIDPASYVKRNGVAVLDEDRDRAYTRELADVIVRAYARETVLLGSHIVAHVLYRHLVASTPGMDVFTRVRQKSGASIPFAQLAQEVGEARDKLVQYERNGEIHLDGALRVDDPAHIVSHTLDIWRGYHTRIAAERVGDNVVVDDPTLILYYQNRAVRFAEGLATEDTAAAAREIAMGALR